MPHIIKEKELQKCIKNKHILLTGGDGPLGTQLRELKDAIMDLMMKCGKITNDVGSSKQSSTRSEEDVRAAEEAIDAAEKALRDAEIYIEREGMEALRKAKEAQERFGQQSQRMTDIARQARDEAERQNSSLFYVVFKVFQLI